MAKVVSIADRQPARGANISKDTSMKHPVIVEGEAFPWNEDNPHGEVIDGDGEVNWAAAAFADPGCMKCPGCGIYLWREGLVVQCPDCGHQWDMRKK